MEIYCKNVAIYFKGLGLVRFLNVFKVSHAWALFIRSEIQ